MQHLVTKIIVTNLEYPHDAIKSVDLIYSLSTTIFLDKLFGKNLLYQYNLVQFMEMKSIHIVAYADDLIRLTSDIKSIQTQFNKIDKFCK